MNYRIYRKIASKFKPFVRKICEISNTPSAENTDENNLWSKVTSDLLPNNNASHGERKLQSQGSVRVIRIIMRLGTHHFLDAKLMRTTTVLKPHVLHWTRHPLLNIICFILLDVMSSEYKDHEGEQEEAIMKVKVDKSFIK